MAAKYIGYSQVLETRTKGQPEGRIRVKLRAPGEKSRWERMSLRDYERRSVIR